MAIMIALIAENGEVDTAYVIEQQKQVTSNVSYQAVTPLWNEISNIYLDISANGTTLYPEAYINAKSSSSSIRETMYLEKYTSGRWQTDTSWKIEGINNVFISKTHNGVSNTTYRVRVLVTVGGEQAEVISVNTVEI